MNIAAYLRVASRQTRMRVSMENAVSMKRKTDGDGGVDDLDVALLDENFARFQAQPFDLFLRDGLAASQLLDLPGEDSYVGVGHGMATNRFFRGIEWGANASESSVTESRRASIFTGPNRWASHLMRDWGRTETTVERKMHQLRWSHSRVSSQHVHLKRDRNSKVVLGK